MSRSALFRDILYHPATFDDPFHVDTVLDFR
jgi:hypothetical protein